MVYLYTLLLETVHDLLEKRRKRESSFGYQFGMMIFVTVAAILLALEHY